jgi:hypothetical protein
MSIVICDMFSYIGPGQALVSQFWVSPHTASAPTGLTSYFNQESIKSGAAPSSRDASPYLAEGNA